MRDRLVGVGSVVPAASERVFERKCDLLTTPRCGKLGSQSARSARTAARARKDFKESDRIRDELAAMGVVLKDGKDADGKPVTTWEIAR